MIGDNDKSSDKPQKGKVGNDYRDVFSGAHWQTGDCLLTHPNVKKAQLH